MEDVMKDSKLSMDTPGEKCNTCQEREATVFMVVRENGTTAKAHVCMGCFEDFREIPGGTIEAVSLQEFKESDTIDD
jgi:protein-arginine kinase activator protein McsA